MIHPVIQSLALTSLVVLGACTSFGGRPGQEIERPAYYPSGTPEFLVEAGSTQESTNYPVFFGTSRKPLASAVGFSEARDSSLHYGRVWVTIPKNHQTGSLGTVPGTIFQYDPKLTLASIEMAADEKQFLALAMREIPPVTSPATGYVVVFIHGYNNSFENAVLRAAQLGIDLGVPRNDMFLYSWAAKHSIPKYTLDEATIDASEIFLRSFLRTVAKAAGARKIHLIAHSMGNRALIRVVASSVTNTASEVGVRFGQIIVAAADVDRDVFAQLAPSYLKVSDRTTVYLSPYDYAVGLSDAIHDYPRVGCGTSPQVVVPGIDSVVSTIQYDFPGHAYFAEAIPVLKDVKNLILRNEPARSGREWTRLNGYWTVGGVLNKGKIACRND